VEEEKNCHEDKDIYRWPLLLNILVRDKRRGRDAVTV